MEKSLIGKGEGPWIVNGKIGDRREGPLIVNGKIVNREKHEGLVIGEKGL